MARLIPRKQIEEQQNITGSLEIGQDVSVGGNSIVAGNSVVSGSLEVLQDFFLGDQLTDRGEITGSVFLTGSLEINGELIFAGPEAVLSATSSNALLAQDTLRYEGIRARTLVLTYQLFMYLQPMVMMLMMVEPFSSH